MNIRIEDIYRRQVIGEDKYTSPKTLEQLYEDVSLYVKDGEGFQLVGDVSDEIYRKVQRAASGKNAAGIIEQYLTEKEYTRDSFKGADDYDLLVEVLDNGEFENYIESGSIPSLTNNRVDNIVNLAGENGMNEKLARRVANLQPVDKGGSNIGPGEILIALTFSDVTNATGGGDLSLNGKPLEVKGQGGRLGQQGGRGGVNFDVSTLTAKLENPPTFKAASGKDIVSLPAIIYTLFKSYTAENKGGSFLKDIKQGLKSVYPHSNMNYFDNVDFENGLDTKSGIRINRGPIRKALTKINFESYANKYDYDNFVFINKDNFNYAMFTREEALKEGGLIDQGVLITENYTLKDFFPNFSYIFK